MARLCVFTKQLQVQRVYLLGKHRFINCVC